MRISDWSSDVCSSDLSFPKAGRIHSPARASYPAAGQASAEVAMLSRMNGSLTRASSQRTATIKQGAMERMVRAMTPKNPASMEQKIHDWTNANLGLVASPDRKARWWTGREAGVKKTE